MTELLNLITNDFLAFLLVLGRVTAFVMVVPFFSNRMFPMPVRAGFSLFLAMLLTASVPHPVLPPEAAPFFFRLLGEVGLGLTLGFIGTLLIAAIDLAGEMISMQVGFGIVSVIDPSTEDQVSIVSQFKMMVFTMVLLLVGGHLLLLGQLAGSFEAVPAGTVRFDGRLAAHLFVEAGRIFTMAVQIGAPVVVVLLLISGAMGIIARTIPQMNIFLVGFALRIIVGVFFLTVILQFFPLIADEILAETIFWMKDVTRALAGAARGGG